jgi:hypothetical protein
LIDNLPITRPNHTAAPRWPASTRPHPAHVRDVNQQLRPPVSLDKIGKLGGTTTWKLSTAAARLTAQARRHGLWVHMGRINSRRRLRHAAAIGCHSADGTYLAYGPDKNLPKLLGWLTTVDSNTTREQQHTESAGSKYPTPFPNRTPRDDQRQNLPNA